VDRHADALFRYALLQTRDRAAAEDCVQETFLAALQARDAFRGKSSERTWLIGILHHKVCDHFRRRGRETQADDPEALASVNAMFRADGVWKQIPRKWAFPEAPLRREEFRRALQECLSKIPFRMSDLFCLREIHGLKTGEICQIMEITPTNLSVQLHRARALLRQCLERSWAGGERP
jgi:RNA polymerase sigma-70 factor (ECF subfamily)